MARNHGRRVEADRAGEALHDQGGEKVARVADAKGKGGRSPSRNGGRPASYEDWSKKDLYQRAREIGIPDRSRMSKSELVDAIRRH